MKLECIPKKTSGERVDFLNELFEKFSFGIVIVAIKTRRIVDFNKNAREALGYSEEEFAQKSVHDLQVERINPEETKRLVDQVMKTGSTEFETLVKTKQGDEKTFRIIAQIMDAKKKFLLCTWVDITKQKQIESELREREKKYRLITEKMSDIVWIADMNLQVIYVTPSVQTVLGFTQEERKQKTAEEQFTADSLDCGLEVLARELAIEKQGNGDPNRTVTLQLEHYHKDGSTRWVETIIGGIRNNQGVLTGLHGVSRDITERKQVEEELSLKTALLEAQSETTVDGMLVVSKDMRAILFNKRFGELWEIPQALLNTKDDRKILESVSWKMKDREEFLQKVDYLYRETDRKSSDEIELVDGRFFDRYSAPLTSATGKYYGRIWYFRDVTEKKQVEKRLKQQTDAMEAAIDGLAILNADQVYIYVNKAHAKIYGYEKDELIGQSWRILYAEEELKRFETEIMPELFQKGFVRVNATGKKKDGSIFFQEIALTVLKDGGLICAVHDVTERKKVEEESRERAEALRSMLDATPVGVGLLVDRVIQKVNYPLCKMTGYSEEEILGRTTQVLYPDEEEYLRVGRELYGQMRKEGLGTVEARLRRKDGAPITVILNLSSFNPDNPAAGVTATIMDITEARHAEEEKRNLEDRLNRAEKMEALGILAGGVAHDLNNVLGVVIGYAELLMMNPEDQITKGIKEKLEKILEGGQKAAAIVQDLLTLARRGVPTRKVISLNKIVINCQQSPEFEKILSHYPGIQIKVSLEPDILKISGSPVHLEKTLFNLVSNAAESMHGGGTLTIKTSNLYLDKLIHGYDELREGDYVVLSVSDTGEGIPTEDLKRIFEPFYTKKVMGRSGTGLGLAVVWGTVKDHNGYIDVESEIGKGSTFTLYFPVTREDAEPEKTSSSILEYDGNGESILVVDDVRGQREVASAMLEKLNYKVSVVSSGEEAVQYLEKNRADLVVLDMIMDPGMDGLDTYKKILEIRPKQKTIIVSGFSESERVLDAQKLGAGAYVRKPYVFESLGVAVKKELDRK